ncbi:MAG: hypothetical protein DHS20C09_04590 [marine bacterium B5-7]|nr:MAG: hypothetical protein DHS20C09_04590 [marine bacterium B5-7]
MNSVFISYSSQDSKLARGLFSAATMAGIETFLAEISIEPGKNWTKEIFDNLSDSEWVFFLASQSSIKSAAVQQELGASLAQKKILIPLLIDIPPEDLPGWIDRAQAIDLASSPEVLHLTISKIAEKIKVDKFWAGVIVGIIVAGLAILIAKS